MSNEATPPASNNDGESTTSDSSAQGEQSETVDYRAKYEAVLAESRKHEQRAKANAAAAKELEALKRESMSELERAVTQAREEATREATAKANARLVAAEVRAAAAGRAIDTAALLEALDTSRFIGDDGELDSAAIAAWVDRIAPQPTEQDPPRRTVDLGQGPRGDMATPLGSDPLLRDLQHKLGI